MESIILNNEQLKKIQSIELELLCEIDSICRKNNITYTLGYGTLLGCIRHNGFIPWDDDIDICILRSDYERFRSICKTELSDKYFYQSHDTDKCYYYLWDKIRVNDTVFKETYVGRHDIHHGIFIDVFPIDNVPNVRSKFRIQYLIYKFYKTGLMIKYVDIKARRGKKKLQAWILRFIFAPFSLEYLYKKSLKSQMKYSSTQSTNVANFASAYGMKDEFPKAYYTDVEERAFEGQKFFVSQKSHDILTKLYGDYMQLPPVEKQCTIHDLQELKFLGESTAITFNKQCD